ncbi:MAG: hypothetical protein Q8T08_25510 [Ignavibacteria bacterium]|nr:hypothetical protein [Ignavibacteria bacterium]
MASNNSLLFSRHERMDSKTYNGKWKIGYKYGRRARNRYKYSL